MKTLSICTQFAVIHTSCVNNVDDVLITFSAVQAYDLSSNHLSSSPRVYQVTKRPAPSCLDSSVGRALQRYRRSHGFESRSGLDLFPGFNFTTA